MIDKIYLLHHKPAKERLLYFNEKCKQFNIVNVSIIDKHLPESITDEECIFLQKSEVSHLKKYVDALNDALNSGYEYILIMEDDIDLDIDYDFNDYIKNILCAVNQNGIQDFDLIWVGGHPSVSNNIMSNHIIVDLDTNKGSRCTHAVIINMKTCNWVDIFWELDKPVDHKYIDIINRFNLKSVWIYPYLYQRSNVKTPSYVRDINGKFL